MSSFVDLLKDAISEDPMLSFILFISTALIVVMIFEFLTMKNNQTQRLVSARIGKDAKGNKIKKIDKILQFIAEKDKKIELELKRANVLLTVKEYARIRLFALGIALIVGIVINPLGTVFETISGGSGIGVGISSRVVTVGILGAAGYFSPKIWIFIMISKRKKMLENQISDALMNMADALKSGHVIQDAIKVVGEQMPYPMGNEFAKSFREMETGKTLEQALEDLKMRVDIKDFTMAIDAIEIQYEVGGKLEPLLRNMVKIINDRAELKKEIEKTIANSKMTGIILLCAPWLFIILFSFVDKSTYTVMLQSVIGIILFVVAAICYIIAAAIIIYIIRDVSKDL